MSEEQLIAEIDLLKQEISKLKDDVEKTEKDRKRSFWISLISTIVLPLAIAASGYWFSQAIKTQELNQAHQHDALDSLNNQDQLQVSLKNQRLETYKFVSPFLDAILNGDAKKRLLATKVITSVMPDEGPQLLNALIAADPDNSKQYQQQLDDKQLDLIKNLFSDNALTRTSSANDIMVNWYKTPSMAYKLTLYASSHMDNANGIYNSVAVLQNMHGSVLKVQKDSIQSFLQKVIQLKNMPKTTSNAAALNSALSKL